MSRLIDADILTEVLKSNGLKDSLVYMFIDQEPTVDAKPKWIPVSERLPEEAFGCLVTVVDYNPFTGDSFPNLLPFFVGCDDGRWYDYDGEEIPYTVLAWIQLPKPYKEVIE